MTDGLTVVTGASGGPGAAIAIRLHRTGRPLLLMSRRQEEMVSLGLDGAIARGGRRAGRGGGGDRARRGHRPLRAGRDPGEQRRGAAPGRAGLPGGGRPARHDGRRRPGRRRSDPPGASGHEIERQSGTIVVVSSLGARQVFAHEAAYCASKAAVHAICEGLRLEAAPHTGRRHVLDPHAVAEVVGLACDLPRHVCVRELHVAHTRQS